MENIIFLLGPLARHIAKRGAEVLFQRKLTSEEKVFIDMITNFILTLI
jgi:hypothetical protein